MEAERSIHYVLMRGGTSKGIFLRAAELPSDASEREATILSLFGSPDRRQVDGLGGADPLTSKVAIVGPAPGEDADITYTFGQVEIDRPEIDYASPCGNVISAVGVYAIEEGYVEPRAPLTPVRVYNTNLRRIITVEVPVSNGRILETGSFSIPGVPGTGSRIVVDFADCAGCTNGGLLPTGNVRDTIRLKNGRDLDVSLVDIANPHVYVRASDFGLSGTETAPKIDGDADLLERIEEVRGIAAVKFGLVRDPQAARTSSRITPMLAFVCPPASYGDDARRISVSAGDVDVVSRLIFLEKMHPTYAATSVVCTGVAARLPGSLVHEVTRLETTGRTTIRIGHPAGVFETEVIVDFTGDGPRVRRATLGRTARRLAEGTAFLRK